MQHNWMTDVLADLAAYAGKNNLPLLAAQIGETRKFARQQIAASECTVRDYTDAKGWADRNDAGGAGILRQP